FHSGTNDQLIGIAKDILDLGKRQEILSYGKIGAGPQVQPHFTTTATATSKIAIVLYFGVGIVQPSQAIKAQGLVVHKIVVHIAVYLEHIEFDIPLLFGKIIPDVRGDDKFVHNGDFCRGTNTYALN